MQKLAVGFIALWAGSTLVFTPGLKAAGFDITGTVTGTQSLSANQSGTVETSGTLTVSTGTDVAIKGNGAALFNYGVISETGTSRAVRDNSGYSWTLTNTGTISAAGNDAVQTGTTGSTITVTNSGTIETLGTGSALNGQAIDFNATNSGSTTINNNAGGVLTAADADAIRAATGGVINNDGKIFGSNFNGDSGSDGIDAQSNSGSIITNANNNLAGSANLIEGGTHGITGGNTGTLNNVAQTGLQFGSYLGTGSFTMTITNNSHGTIQGDNGSGINIDGFGISSGTVTPTGTKLVTNELVTVTNAGTITGNGVTGDGDGIDVDGAVNVTNSGTIVSRNSVGSTGDIAFSEGITVGGGTITNSSTGLIEGQIASGNTTPAVGRGITLAGVDKDGTVGENPIPIESVYSNSTINNSGLIRGDTESGIAVLGTTGGGYTVTINNTGGTIRGNNTGTPENTVITTGPSTGSSNGQSLNQGAIELDDTGDTYVINTSGTITQDNTTGGVAIAAHGVANSVNVTGASAAITGNIIGDTGKSNTLVIDPTSTGTFAYNYNVTNFGTELKSGTTQLSGTFSPSGAQGFTVDSKATLAPGGTQPAPGLLSRPNGNLTLSDAGITSGSTLATFTGATLTFALGTSGASQIDVAGTVPNKFTFGGTTVSINDLADVNLGPASALTLIPGTEYVLIQGSDTAFSSLSLGAPNVTGQELITGGLSLASSGAFAAAYNGSQLYLDPTNDRIDIQVGTVAVPEPQTWLTGLLGIGFFAFLLRSRRLMSSC